MGSGMTVSEHNRKWTNSASAQSLAEIHFTEAKMAKNRKGWLLTAEHTEGGEKEIATITGDLSGKQVGKVFADIVLKMEEENVWPDGFDAIATDCEEGYMFVLEGDDEWEPIF
jgi:hypothetical protein